MFHTRRKLHLSCLVLLALSLTACGGGVTPQPPLNQP